MPDAVDVFWSDVVRGGLFVLAVLSVVFLLGGAVGGYVGWSLGMDEGRQQYEAVACEPIVNERVKPGIRAVP